MNILVIGKDNLKENLKYTSILKEHFHLDNFNMFLATTKELDYRNIIDCNIDLDGNTYHNIKDVLKKHRYHLIIIDLNIDNYEFLDNIIPKFSKANIMLIQKDEIPFIKYKYKIIPFGSIKANLSNKNNYDYALSLCFLDYLYHIDILKSVKVLDDQNHDIAIKVVKKIESNPYNSNINHLKLCFFNNFSFIDDLYFFYRFSYILDNSADTIDNKIKALDKKYDIYFLYDNQKIDKDIIKKSIGENVIYLSNDNYNYQDIFQLINKLIKKE